MLSRQPGSVQGDDAPFQMNDAPFRAKGATFPINRSLSRRNVATFQMNVAAPQMNGALLPINDPLAELHDRVADAPMSRDDATSIWEHESFISGGASFGRTTESFYRPIETLISDAGPTGLRTASFGWNRRTLHRNDATELSQDAHGKALPTRVTW